MDKENSIGYAHSMRVSALAQACVASILGASGVRGLVNCNDAGSCANLCAAAPPGETGWQLRSNPLSPRIAHNPGTSYLLQLLLLIACSLLASRHQISSVSASARASCRLSTTRPLPHVRGVRIVGSRTSHSLALPRALTRYGAVAYKQAQGCLARRRGRS